MIAGEHTARSAMLQMGEILSGVAPTSLGHPNGFERVRVAARVLLEQTDPQCRQVGQAFDDWLREGGDLVRMLGLKVPRGRADQLPHRQAEKAAVRDALLQLAAALGGATPEAQAANIRRAMLQHDPVITHLVGEAPLSTFPRSQDRLARILRSRAG